MTSIVYKSEAHKARFLLAIEQINKIYDGKLDQEYGAALYVLTSSHSTWMKCQHYVSRDGIDFETMFKEVDFSGGHSVLIQWAANLFNEHIAHCDPIELMRLDDSNFMVALNALQLRRVSLSIDDLK